MAQSYTTRLSVIVEEPNEPDVQRCEDNNAKVIKVTLE